MRSRFFPLLLGLLVFSIILAGVVRLDGEAQYRFIAQSRQGPSAELLAAREAVELAMNSRMFLAKALAAAAAADPAMDQDSFQALVKGLLGHNPPSGIFSIRLARADGVEFIYFPGANQESTGKGPVQAPLSGLDVRKAFSSREFVVAGPFRSERFGMEIYGCAPVFPPQGGILGDYWGMAVVVASVETLLREAGIINPQSDLVYALRGPEGRGAPSEVFYGDSSTFDEDPVTADLLLPTGHWRIAAVPAGGWKSLPPGQWWVRGLGILLALACGSLVWTLAREPLRLRQAVLDATAASRESEERFRSLFEANFEALVVHDKGLILDANKPFENMFGYPMAEAIGMSVDNLVAEESKALVKQEMKEAQERPYEARVVRKDGKEFYVEVIGKFHVYRGRRVRVTALRDITQQKRVAGDLQYRLELEELIAGISTHFINLAPGEIGGGIKLALESVGRFSDAERSYVFMVSEDAKTMDVTHAWRSPDSEAESGRAAGISTGDFPWLMGKVRNLETVNVPCIRDLPDEMKVEREEWLGRGLKSLLCVPMVYAGEFRGFIALDSMRIERKWTEDDAVLLRLVSEIIVSAIERERSEETLRRANESLDEANRQLRQYSANLEAMVKERTAELDQQKERALEASRAKSEFLSSMSHELRTPLNSILGLTQVVLMKVGGELPGQQRENLHNIISSGRRLLDLINEILDLSKIEAGKHDLALSVFPVGLLINDAARSMRHLIERKGLELRVVDSSPGASVRSDHGKLLQILVNLLGNALKFTDEGFIELSARQEMGGFILAVRDSGIGLTPEEQEIIFERFRQADASSTRRYGGTGLGLTISRHLSQLLGGRLGVVSQEGKGSTFTLWIPRSIDAAGAEIAVESQKPRGLRI
jgi:PAS domain S-box-containing protein